MKNTRSGWKLVVFLQMINLVVILFSIGALGIVLADANISEMIDYFAFKEMKEIGYESKGTVRDFYAEKYQKETEVEALIGYDNCLNREKKYSSLSEEEVYTLCNERLNSLSAWLDYLDENKEGIDMTYRIQGRYEKGMGLIFIGGYILFAFAVVTMGIYQTKLLLKLLAQYKESKKNASV